MSVQLSDVRAAGLTIRELARLTGIDSQRLYRATAGSHNLTEAEHAAVYRVVHKLALARASLVAG